MAIGAYAVERDHSHYIANASRTVLAVVGTATKGPIGEAVVVTNSQDLVNKFGPLNVGHLALYAGQYFLSQSSKMYFVRAAGDSVAASKATVTGVDVNDEEITNAVVVEMLEKGTYSNNYTLVISEGTLVGDYNLLLKNNKGVVLEEIKNIPLTDIVKDYSTKYFKILSVDSTITTLTVGEYEFVGGSDGVEDIVAGDYINAANALLADKVDINLISVPGVSDAAVVTGIIAIAESRGDSFYLIDPPEGLTKEGVIQWVNGGGIYEHSTFDTSYGGVYFDWSTIYDSVNKQYVKIPPSVVVAATYAYSDRISELWYAPAGLTRGLVRGIISPVTSLTRADIELLYDNNINSIYEDPQVGNVIWGQKTLYREATALNRVNVRRLLNYLKKVIVSACNHLVFEPNDRVTWNSFEMKVIPTLESIKNRRGIYDYKVVKGEAIVTDEDIDNYRMPCMILISPTKAAEEIPIHFVITSTGADFNEVLEANGIIN